MVYPGSVSKLRKSSLLLCFVLLLSTVFAGQAMAKDWTVLVYLAADNDLAPFGIIDINEMEQIGSTDSVDVVVQFDGSEEYSPEAAGSCRYHIQKDSDMKTVTSPVVEDLGEIDMGSQQTLKEFLEWGMTKYPSDKTFLIIWNHGNGWYQSLEESSIDLTAPKDVEDIMAAVEAIEGGSKSGLNKYVASKRIQSLLNGRTSVRPFATAVVENDNPFDDVDVAVAIDEGGEGGATALSTTDIREAIQAADKTLGNRGKIELVGFDACLMSMVEVYHELRDVANFSVASMKTEPGDGWPYERFLASLNENPSMDGGELGSKVVDGYSIHYYRSNLAQENPFHRANCTLATVDLSQIGALTSALDALGRFLCKPELRDLLWTTVINTQHCGEIAQTEPTVLIQLTAHRDVLHFAQNLRNSVINSAPDGVDPSKLINLIDKVIETHNNSIVSFRKLEASPLMGIENANGIAVSIPFLRLEASYTALEFGKTGWTDFIKAFKATPQEAQQLVEMMTGGKEEEGAAADESNDSKFDSLHDM